MKLLVFGATGGTGQALLVQALEQGYKVVAFACDPGKLTATRHPRLYLRQGNVLDPVAVESAVGEQEVVLSTIGAGAGRSIVREAGTRNIVEATAKAGVRRLICQSSLGVGDSRSNLSFVTKYLIVAVFLRHAFADHERQEAVVKASALDWTIVRPPYLTNGPRTEIYRHGFGMTDRRIKGKISRADVADFMLKQLTDARYLNQTPGVSY